MYAGGSHIRPMHPSVGSSGLGTSCSPSPPKSVLSQSAPADVNAYTFLRCDIDADNSVGNLQVRRWQCCIKMCQKSTDVNFKPLSTIIAKGHAAACDVSVHFIV